MTELVTQEDINKLVDLYFKQPDIMYSHLFSSYHQLIEEIIPYILSQENYFYESVDKDYVYLHGFKCNNIRLRPCTFENNSKLLFPNQARKNYLSYFGTIVADVQQYVVKENILSGEKTTKLIDNMEKDTVLARVPVMVKSKFCSTVIKKDLHGECKYDPGGIFLVNGQEKVIVSIEKMVDNKILVFSRRDSSYPAGKYFYTHINSRKNDWSDNLQIINIKQKKNGVFTIISSQFSDIPIFILFKAMGLETDKDIISNITYDIKDIKLLNLLRPSLTLSTDEENNIIRTKEEAIEYLITKLKRNKRISQSDEDLAKLQKRVLLEKIIRVDLLPHMGNDIPGKIRFLGLMMNKLLNVVLGRREPDDRDGIMNKRIETPGILIGQLFKQNWKKLLNEVGKMFRKKNQNDMIPINVVGSLRSNTIEQGIKTALATGMWGMNRTKKGVAQSLQRLSWIQAIAYLRRIVTPSMNDATSGVISIRHLNNIAMYFLCPTETPEGQKIGLHKSLAMTATLSLQNDSQILIVKDIIDRYGNYHHPADVDPLTINEWSKIFINGNWIGVTKKILEIFTLLKEARRNGTIEKTVSLCLDCMNKEINVYTDGGRLIRPLLNLKDNKLTLTKKIVKEIDELANSHDSVKGWKTLLSKYTDLVDYEDVESTNFLMIASGLDSLEKNNDNINKKIIHNSDNKDTLDRYGAYRYVNYSHCEFHPWLMLGTVTSTIPFANHNYGTKNIVNFSQVKQAIGIYLTSYKDRMDISQILYHPQLPIVRTKGTKYNHLDDLPTGENAIVAIMSYNGYNQEDSLIFNQTALDRGLFRADTLKKYHGQIEKNPSTSQDDEFRKPDRNKVTGIKQANYDKLNEQGFVPEETEIESGDIIIGKVSPIQPTGNDNKIYKDNSELYKHNVDGVIDRVHTGVYNADGYEMYNVRVRQERKPIIGDKFSNRHGQKGTLGISLSQKDMPYTEEGIIPDIILNPHAIPSRMTISQLIECMASKIGALEGKFVDGTPFSNYNVSELPKILEKLGYSKFGTETMYCGMTGKKMEAKIFIGPTYYIRLKHMVLDKVHARSSGPRQALTRQPLEGRSRDGGLKIGEMEKDAMVAHGCGQFLKERMMETSDITKVHVCDECGLFASKVIDKDYYKCLSCPNSNISAVNMPYACKLLFQELTSVNIVPRVKAKKTIFGDNI